MAPTSTQARAGAHLSWSRTADRAARTANGTAAFLARFEREVDPDGTLAPAERQRRAESARRAYFLNLAAKSAAVRRSKVVGDDDGALVGRRVGSSPALVPEADVLPPAPSTSGRSALCSKCGSHHFGRPGGPRCIAVQSAQGQEIVA